MRASITDCKKDEVQPTAEGWKEQSPSFSHGFSRIYILRLQLHVLQVRASPTSLRYVHEKDRLILL